MGSDDCLYEGEVIKYRAERVEIQTHSSVRNGSINISNYRIMCIENGKIFRQVPLLHIEKVTKRDRVSDKSRDFWDNEQASTRNPLTHKMAVVTFHVADSHPFSITFFVASTLTDEQTDEFFPNPIRQCNKVASAVAASAFPTSITQVFAFNHRIECPIEYDGWAVYKPEEEFGRLGIPDAHWRISYINHDYSACATYPRMTCVPAELRDWELKRCLEFRSLDRFPCLCWKDRKSDAVICRSSQPLTGIFKARNREDERLVQLIRNANSSGGPLYIVDTRPQINAVANSTLKGAGYEGTKYENCEVVFLGVENIHNVRKSYLRLRELCLSSNPDDEHWLWLLEQTRWINLLSTILYGARRTAEMIAVEGASVLIHCSDGWDRTPQISSLAQIMLDPYYRTLRGFQILIEKEWCSFGHKFAHRVGHGNQVDQAEVSPVFMQFADAVAQLTRQFPTRFEFNERLLLLMIQHTRSGRFGTFLFNSELERRKAGVFKKTTSFWTDVNLNRNWFLNSHYEHDREVLLPDPSVRRLHLWESYFFRDDEKLKPHGPVMCKAPELQVKVHQLEARLAEMEEQLLQYQAMLGDYQSRRGEDAEDSSRNGKNGNKTAAAAAAALSLDRLNLSPLVDAACEGGNMNEIDMPSPTTPMLLPEKDLGEEEEEDEEGTTSISGSTTTASSSSPASSSDSSSFNNNNNNNNNRAPPIPSMQLWIPGDSSEGENNEDLMAGDDNEEEEEDNDVPQRDIAQQKVTVIMCATSAAKEAKDTADQEEEEDIHASQLNDDDDNNNDLPQESALNRPPSPVSSTATVVPAHRHSSNNNNIINNNNNNNNNSSINDSMNTNNQYPPPAPFRRFSNDSSELSFSYPLTPSISAASPTVAVTWQPDELVDYCPKCNVRFTFLNRKHHCRICGIIFCASCSSKRVQISHIENGLPVRACDKCFQKLESGGSKKKKHHHREHREHRHGAVSRSNSYDWQ